MNRLKLFNLSHEFSAPAAEDKPIFLPFGTWAYDGKISQTFTREAAARIANELAADVAAGNPGIPVYQGHPDVPSLAAKYPDKGALGWVKKIDLSNEGCSLTVDWDRFPGKGFGWFSPYWFGEKTGLDNQGKTLVAVDHIESIGLVNNPNISEFRLPNEAQPEERKTMKPYQLPQRIIDLANEYDESKHPRADDGKFTSVGGSGGGTSGNDNDRPNGGFKAEKYRGQIAEEAAHTYARISRLDRASRAREINDGLRMFRGRLRGQRSDHWNRLNEYQSVRAQHRAAIFSGLKYNLSTHQYE